MQRIKGLRRTRAHGRLSPRQPQALDPAFATALARVPAADQATPTAVLQTLWRGGDRRDFPVHAAALSAEPRRRSPAWGCRCSHRRVPTPPADRDDRARGVRSIRKRDLSAPFGTKPTASTANPSVERPISRRRPRDPSAGEGRQKDISVLQASCHTAGLVQPQG